MEDRRTRLLDIVAEQDKDWSSIVRQCQDYAECCGLLVRRRVAEGKCCIQMGSMMLFPSKFPVSIYNQALAVQRTYNELYQKIARDHEFMKETLSSTFAGDEFTKRLWDIHETVWQQGLENPISLEIVRSDYMYQQKGDGFTIAQIEMNTMAASMAVLSEKVNQTHCYLARVMNNPKLCDSSKFPEHSTLSAMAEGLAKAWKLYGNPSAVVLVAVAADEMNFSDIRNVEYEMLKQNEEVKVLVKSTDCLLNSASLSDSRALFVDGHEIAVVYLRVYYDPTNYDEKTWDLRLLLEKSTAIKCPSVAAQLAGSKTIQQALTRPGVLERFLTADECVAIRKSFVDIFALTEDTMSDAMRHPDSYVLKPNREGGGHNYYGDDIITKLKEIVATNEQDAYILMERVYPAPQYNCRLTISDSEAVCSCLPTVSELGIYGVVIGSSSRTIHNTTSGYLLRTKPTSANEGGYHDGHSSLDTPCLLEDQEMIKELKYSANNVANCC